MENLEELEKRKRELELRRDIARLERNEKLANRTAKMVDNAATIASKVEVAKSKTSKWSWGIVVPCSLVGAFLIFAGIVDSVHASTLIGVVLLFPLFAKMVRQK